MARHTYSADETRMSFILRLLYSMFGSIQLNNDKAGGRPPPAQHLAQAKLY